MYAVCSLAEANRCYNARVHLSFAIVSSFAKATTVYVHILSLILLILGPLGIVTILVFTGYTLHLYQGGPVGSFRWHLRNARLKQLSGITCLFLLAMSASYIVLRESWSILYFIIALKVGTWWLRCLIDARS